ncbi:hypothetical protein HWV62_39886 [Athelia sp. TMB]|nr:hypothetical protein HWV62_39886 [Athelia sp. TMB]
MASVAGIDLEAGPTTSPTTNLGPGVNALAAEDRMWSLYLMEADKLDKARMENWKGDMDGILIFSGLFSAVITAFIIESYQMLQQDPADVTVMLLAQISMQLAANASSPVHALSPANIPFQPSRSAQSINALWFLSLLFSLTCALLATLVQQWARQYLQVVGNLKGTKDRAALRTYMAQGHERYRAEGVVDTMPALLHASLFLFFAGLVQFLHTINEVVTWVTLAPIVLLFLVYSIITIQSALSLDCPYRTPLSHLVWKVKQSVISTKAYRTLACFGPPLIALALSASPLSWVWPFRGAINVNVLPQANNPAGMAARLMHQEIMERTPEIREKKRGQEMSHRRERDALKRFKNYQTQYNALAFVREGLVGREEYLSFFNNLPQFLRARNLRLAMSHSQSQWVGVWCSFPPSMWGEDEEADLAWLRSLFSMLSQDVVSFPNLSNTLRRTANRMDSVLVRLFYRDEEFPPEVQIFLAVGRIRLQTVLPRLVHYANLCEFVMVLSHSGSGEVNWSGWVVELFNLLSRSHPSTTLPGTEGGTAVQDTLRFLTRKAFLTPGADDRDQSGFVMNESQRESFLAALYPLLDQPHVNSQTPPNPLSTLGHFYVFDIVREYNSQPHDVNPPWADGMRRAYRTYLEGTTDLGDLKEYFDQLGNSFPYAPPVGPRTDPLSEADGTHLPENTEMLVPEADSSNTDRP